MGIDYISAVSQYASVGCEETFFLLSEFMVMPATSCHVWKHVRAAAAILLLLFFIYFFFFVRLQLAVQCRGQKSVAKSKGSLGPVQTSNFSCAQSNANEQNLLF